MKLALESEDSFCRCENAFPVKLMFTFSERTICCVKCNLEVDRSDFLEIEQSSQLLSWKAEYEAIYRLWLASGKYETWAMDQLSSPKSRLNEDGLSVARLVSAVERCYYWIHSDSTNGPAKAACPSCGAPLEKYLESKLPQTYCDNCGIVCSA